MNKIPALPPIPEKRYFTIGEAAELCQVKPHVLRYWEQEFSQLQPMKRRGNRRYYQRQDIELVRSIRDLLYGRGFTISGARQALVQERQLSKELEKNMATSDPQSLLPKLIKELEAVLKAIR